MNRAEASALLERLRPSLEMEAAQWDFAVFLRHASIMEPPPGGGVIHLELWPHLGQVVQALDSQRLVVWLKARQIGATWLLVAYALWTAQYHEGARVLVVSRGEAEARNILRRCRQMWQLLPGPLRRPLTADSSELMEWGATQSAIRALPSTSAAGRSETATLVIMDEADYHPDLEGNLAAVRPTIDDSGGQLVLVSTANYEMMVSPFRSLYQGAPGNGYYPIFFGWQVRPGRDEAWLEKVKAGYPDVARFGKEYPATDSEALAPPESIAAFSPDILQAMEREVRDPVAVRGVARMWQRPVAGRRYVAGTDTSHGVGQDYSVTVVLDAATGYVAADVMSNAIDPSELGYQSYLLLEGYGFPLWGIEDNDWGAVVIAKAQEMGYPRLYHRDETSKLHPERPPVVTRKVGWHTDMKTVWVLWGDLVEAVEAQAVIIPAKDGLAQFWAVVRNPDNRGRLEALGGGHDDYPVAVGIALQVRKELPAVVARRNNGIRESRRRPAAVVRRW